MQQSGTKPRQLLYSVVGLHALTMPQNPKKLLEDRLNTLASILAIGVDPHKAILFFQEDVSCNFWIDLISYELFYLDSATLGAGVAFKL
jgi:tryptophanyl-tRNA synthetase